MLGGAGFSGSIAQVSIYDDAALTAQEMLTGSCASRPSPTPAFVPGTAASAWASSSGAACVNEHQVLSTPR